jgi:2-polyprenyl-6-methoxyphenol hydroxylase-like FAD-dependent oxidoreductase
MLIRDGRLRLLCSVLAILIAASLGRAEAAAEHPDVIIVGGGPVGLAAAIEARRNGAKNVVVLEKRGKERTRGQVLNLLDRTIANISRWGVDVSTAIRPMEAIRFETDGKQRQLRFTAKEMQNEPERATGSSLSVVLEAALRRRAGSIPIAHLEDELARSAAQLGGIEVRYHTAAVKVDAGADHVDVHLEGGGKLRGSYLAIADGAHSPVLASMGFEPVVVGKGQSDRLGWGVFAQRGGNQVVKRTESVAKGPLAKRRILVVPGESTTAIGVDIAPGTDLAAPGKLAAYLKEAAAKVGVEGELVQAPSDFQAQRIRAARLNVGNRIFVLGDAARSGTPMGGLGINFALRDVVRFGSTWKKLVGAKTDGERSRIARSYSRRTRGATLLLHTLSTRFMQKRR